MKKLVTVLLTLFLLTGCGYELPSPAATRPETAAVTTAAALPETTAPAVPPAPTQPEETCSKTRPAYDHGTCRHLKDAPQAVLLYLNDDDSSWDPESIAGSTRQVSEGLDFLQSHAHRWGVELSIPTVTYRDLRYRGSVETDFKTLGETKDLLTQIAAQMDQPTAQALHRQMTEQYENRQVVYLVLLNKEGHSYSQQDNITDGIDSIEYSVIFNGYPGSPLKAGSATIAHEFLHLFGAEDYYDPYGNQPARKLLAQTHFENDIMLCTYTDISSNTVGEVTAYSVGWLEDAPELVKSKDWWQ